VLKINVYIFLYLKIHKIKYTLFGQTSPNHPECQPNIVSLINFDMCALASNLGLGDQSVTHLGQKEVHSP
jgi:hypothetical protein